VTKWEAAKDLQTVMDQWLDFDYWSYLQLEMRGEWSQERIAEVAENHERAERLLNEHQAKISARMSEMRDTGATSDEINAYRRTTRDERDRLVKAWRSLDGIPKEKTA